MEVGLSTDHPPTRSAIVLLAATLSYSAVQLSGYIINCGYVKFVVTD
ncbi:MAG: hypothetical protein DSM106950_06775 [Stigonema ocellatum SAG 48.90 = DSM 106950]|nr:hypothetical protein [Stigonema ocellatum SAG 48.90 = DSM 106950]